MARTEAEPGRRTRKQSAIAFPYVDLSAAEDVARAILQRAGRDVCNLSDLADDLEEGLAGAFRLKTSAARIFDLIEKHGRSEVRLTAAGLQLADPTTAGAARVHAFLRVPLYEAIYARFKNKRLPARQDLEDELRELGVPPKQVDKARQVFERSARQAGFFDSQDQRFVRPSQLSPQNGNIPALARAPMREGEEALEITRPDLAAISRVQIGDPLILGLVERLPPAGSPWSDDARIAWLRLASSIFDVTYTQGAGKIEIGLNQDEDELDQPRH